MCLSLTEIKAHSLKPKSHLHQPTMFSWSARHIQWNAAHHVLFAKRSQAACPQPVCRWHQLAGRTPLHIHAYTAPEGRAAGRHWQVWLHPRTSSPRAFQAWVLQGQWNKGVGWGGVGGLWHGDDSFLYCQMRTSEQTLTQQLWCSHRGMLLRKNKKQTPATLHCMDVSLKGMWEEAARCKRVNVSWSHPLHTQQIWGSYNYRKQIRVCLEH